MRTLLKTLLVCLSFVLPIHAFAVDQFQTEQAAQKHCPFDTVVWLNLHTYIWHYKGERWYGSTKNGAYVCMKEAATDGARGARNGQ
jgi:hypothetical protein